MAVHMVQIHVGPQSSWPQADCNAAVEDWMSKQSEWTADPLSHSMISHSPEDADVAWWMGDYRLTFESDPKDNLLQKLEDTLVNKCDWYRLAYHECHNDDPTTGECAWDEQREWTDKDVTIPPEVPNYV